MASIDFVFPQTGTIVGTWRTNDPAGATRGTADPNRGHTRIVVQTTGTATTDEVIITLNHAETGSTIAQFTKSTTEGSLRRTSAVGTGFKYTCFFQFTTKAAGRWTIQAHVKRDGAMLAGESITVRAVTTLWPFFRVAGSQELDVDTPHGGGVHGFTFFRPTNNLDLPGHTIPDPDRNREDDPPGSKMRHDALDVVTTGNGLCRAPFNGKVTMKKLISVSSGHYFHIDGKVITTKGDLVRYRAHIAHINLTLDEGDTVALGQPVGRQTTPQILHFGLSNLNDEGGPLPPGGILGDENRMPGGGRSTYLNSGDRAHERFWVPATSYYASLHQNIRKALDQKRFGRA